MSLTRTCPTCHRRYLPADSVQWQCLACEEGERPVAWWSVLLVVGLLAVVAACVAWWPK